MTLLDTVIGMEAVEEKLNMWKKEALSDRTRSRNLGAHIIRDADGKASFRQEEGKFIFWD